MIRGWPHGHAALSIFNVGYQGIAGFAGVGIKRIHSDDTMTGLELLAHSGSPRFPLVLIDDVP